MLVLFLSLSFFLSAVFSLSRPLVLFFFTVPVKHEVHFVARKMA